MNDSSTAAGQSFREKRLGRALQIVPFFMMFLSMFLLFSAFSHLGSESEREICNLVGAFSGLIGIYLNLQQTRTAAFEKRVVDLERQVAAITAESIYTEKGGTAENR